MDLFGKINEEQLKCITTYKTNENKRRWREKNNQK